MSSPSLPMQEQQIDPSQGRRLFFLVLRRYATPFSRDFFIALLAGALAAATAGFGIPFMLEYIFPVVFEPELAPAFLIDVLSFLVAEHSMESALLWGAALFIPLVMLVRGVSTYVNTYLLSRAGMGMLAYLRRDLFEKMQQLSLSYLDSKERGDWMTYTLQYTQGVQQSMTTIINDLVIQPLTLLFALVYLVYTALMSTQAASLLGNLLIAVICVPLVRLVGRRIVKQMRKALEGLSQINVTIEESLNTQREVRAFNLQSRQIDRLKAGIAEYSQRMLRLAVWQQSMSPAIEIVSALGLSFALYRGALDGLSLEQFSAIAAAFYFCYTPVKRLGSMMAQIRVVEMMLVKVGSILEAESDMPEPEQPVHLGKRPRGAIRFSDVSFAYLPDEYVLRDINVDIPAGQTVALVGASGSGKTSFINLICRFYDVTEGELRLDDVPVRQISRHDRVRSIALVSQFPALFRGSVRDNIRIGAPDSSDAEVEEAGKLALVDEFTRESQQGYDLQLGEGGSGLSGGQKQRVALARAMLKNAPIFILDEATSALDMKSEAQIQSSLDALSADHTCLIIAHRFSTIRKAERILLFEQGRIIADGSHQQLYSSSALYKRLYDEQMGNEETDDHEPSIADESSDSEPPADAGAELPSATPKFSADSPQSPL